jgi:transcriptional regulator with GAF, ATPase, and Fis domain
MDFILNVWRTACQHIELADSVDRIARLLPAELPADAMMVQAFNVTNRRIETITIGLSRPGPAIPRINRNLAPEQMNDLLAWCRAGSLLHGSAARGEELLRLMVPVDDGDWLAGPLLRDAQPIGALLLLARHPRRFSEKDYRTAQALLEPISVAVKNDLHFHELARLREAVEAENRALLSRLDRDAVSEAIVGAEAGLRDVMERIDQVAPTDVPVLILGETGSGKEVLARAIHKRSRRAAGPVVRVNCGAVPPGLIDSELFGHERGSFTGATAVRKGWFERADGGTLFLDEVAELPLDAQVRLLRILQDGTFERVGGQKPLRVDVRIVAATHRDLRQMVTLGTFREDLWYRISVFPIDLPPLRERIEDVPALAAHFAQRAGRRLTGSPLALSTDDIDVLTAYPWPGNVRELAAVIERAAILGNGRGLAVRTALGPVVTKQGRMSAKDWSTREAAATALTESVTLDAAMRAHITQVLRATHGRIEGPFGAARRLGINPHTLRARMRKLGMNWAAFRASPRRA